MNRGPRLKVLLSAYACGPERVSEPGVGWNAVRQVAIDHDVWVLTSYENRDRIEAALLGLSGSPQFVFVDWPEWTGFVKRTQAGYEVQQYLWQIAAYQQARALHKRIKFDVVHHVTLCRYWMPSFLPLLGVPFVWGPVGGGESAPRTFWRGLGIGGILLEVARECARFIGEHDPMLHVTARRVTLAVATTDETAARMKRLPVPQIEIRTQVALTDAQIEALERYPPPPNDVVRFLSIGRLVAWKGFHLGLHALARMRNRTAEYWIVGDGPKAPALKALAEQLGVASRVRFLGALSRPQVDAALQQCGVLVHPSLHDSGGAVCAEAMAAGRPVICLDLGGPGLQVTNNTGIKVPAVDPDQAIRDLAAAMDRLSASSELRARLGTAARLRVREHFSMDAKRYQFSRWYGQVARPTNEVPHHAAGSTVVP